MIFLNDNRLARMIREAKNATNERFSLSLKMWQIAIEVFQRSRPLIVKGDYRGGWRHPWQVSARWNESIERWEFNLNAGFVNGVDVEMNVPRDGAPKPTLDREDDESKETVTAYLTDESFMPINPQSMRAVGSDADATGTTGSFGGGLKVNYERVPAYFLALGVGETPKQTLTSLGGVKQQIGNLDDEAEKNASGVIRLMRVSEVVLTQDRLAASTSLTLGNGLSGSFVRLDVGYQSAPNAKKNARISVVRKTEPKEPVTVEQQLRGAWADDTFDELHLATIYLVSPAGASAGSVPDKTWKAYAKHHVFWNLNHTTNRLSPPPEYRSLALPIPLAGGAATSFANQTLAAINDAGDRARKFLNSRDISGRFWTT